MSKRTAFTTWARVTAAAAVITLGALLPATLNAAENETGTPGQNAGSPSDQRTITPGSSQPALTVHALTTPGTVPGYAVRLWWTNAADGYTIERSGPPPSTWTKIASLKAASRTYTDAGLAPSTYYQYRLQTRVSGTTATSAPHQVVTHPAPLTTAWRVTTAGPQRSDFTGWVGVRFTVGAAPIEVIEIGLPTIYAGGRVKAKLVNVATGEEVANTSDGLQAYGEVEPRYYALPTPKALPPGTSYYLAAYVQAKQAPWSDQTTVVQPDAAVTVDAAVTAVSNDWTVVGDANRVPGPVNLRYRLALPDPGPGVSAPDELTINKGPGSALLSWQPVPGAASYTLKRRVKVAAHLPFAVVATGVSTTSYTDNGLAVGVPYEYVVEATGGTNTSRPSNKVPSNKVGITLSSGYDGGPMWPFRVDDATHDYDLWIPPKTVAVRGLVVAHAYGFPPDFFQNGELRRMLAANNCGLVLSSAKKPIGFSKPAQFLAAISNLAVASGHAELANAPLLPVGHSNGTAWSAGFAAEYPDRVFGYIACKVANGEQFNKPGAFPVPGLLMSGQNDSSYRADTHQMVEKLRAEHGALMQFILEPAGGHGVGPSAFTILIAFIETVHQLRVPATWVPGSGPAPLVSLSENSGWLGDNRTLAIGTQQTFTGDKKIASWLPSEGYALKWQEFNKTGVAMNEWMSAEFKRCRPLFYGDYYPLTAATPAANAWLAMQYNRADLGEGMVLAFRRAYCAEAIKAFRLSGLDATARYEVTNLDVPGSTLVSGRELMEQGMTVKIADLPFKRWPDPEGRADLTLPREAKIFGPFSRENGVPDADLLRRVPSELTLGGVRAVSKTVAFSADRLANLEPLLEKPDTVAFVYFPFTANESGLATFGFGGDWWYEAYLDGHRISETLSSGGNKTHDFSMHNYTATVEVAKGQHLLVVRFIRGNDSARLAVGGPRDLEDKRVTAPGAAVIVYRRQK